MKYNRLNEIEMYLKEVKTATTNELTEKFDISIQTLRRDLNELETRGTISKVYGGVVYNENQADAITNFVDIQLRTTGNLKEKKLIGQLASSIVEDNDVIFVDSGTTACHIIPFLDTTKHLTVITHSMIAMDALDQLDNVHTILLGGEYRSDVKSFTFPVKQLHYHFTKAFIATVGISLENGLTNTDMYEQQIKAEVIDKSSKVYIVCDSTKFDCVAYNQFATFDKIDGIITDKQPSARYLSYFKKQNIQVLTPEYTTII